MTNTVCHVDVLPSLPTDRRVGRTFQPIRTGANRVWRRLKAWQEWRATIRELHQLRDRELRDIGLCRGEIDGVVGDLSRNRRPR